MNADLINPFLKATKNVIETMAFTELVDQTPFIKEDKKTFGELTGMIGMAGDNVHGNMIISFKKDCILSIVSNMLGEKFEEVSDDVIDAVGEITNMICGGAKTGLAEKGMKIDMALPITIKGEGVEMSQVTDAPILCIPFETPNGQFVVEANLKTR